MNGVTVATPASRPRARALSRVDAAAAAATGVLVAVLAALTWGTWGDLDSDTGYEIAAALRMLEGELPYRDFTYFYGPLAPGLSWLFALPAGADVASAVALGLIVTLGILTATYVLARIVAGPLGAVLATAITGAVAFIPDNYSYVLPHTHAATLGMLLLLTLLLAVWHASETSSAGRFIAVGAALGSLFLTKPEPALAGAVAVGVWLVASGRVDVRRRAALVLGPAFAVPMLVYGAALTRVSPRELLLENLYPTDVLNAGGDVELTGRMPLTASSFVELGAKLALYALGCAALLAVALVLARGGRARLVVSAALAVGVLGAAAASFARPEALRHGLEFAYGWIPAGAALAAGVVLVRRLQAKRTTSRVEQLELAGLAALAVVAFTTYPGFFPHAPHEQMAAYYMPLAAIFVARLHLRELAPSRNALLLGAAWLSFLAAAGLGLTLKDARGESVTVTGPAGSLAESPREAALYQGVVDWIEREAGPGEQIFAAPMLTGLYALTGRTSPTQELALLPSALPAREDELAAIARLEEAGVRIVVTDDRTWPGYGHTQFGESFGRTLARWIAADFEPSASFRAGASLSFEGPQERRILTVWTRRTQ